MSNNPLLHLLHVDALTPRGWAKDAWIAIAEGRIQKIVSPCEALPPLEGEVLTLPGWVASPGWIELQINGAFGVDFAEEPQRMWEIAARLPEFGLTAFLPTLVTSPLEAFRQAMKVWKAGPPPGWQGAIPLGLHFEGPFLNPKKKGAHNPKFLLQPNPDLVADWDSANGVRLVTLAPELPGAFELAQSLHRHGITLAIGHSHATFEEALAAFEQGFSYVTHLYNGMTPLEYRAPGLVGAILTHPEITVSLIADGVHVHPAMLKLAYQTRTPDQVVLVTDAMSALGMPPGRYPLGGGQEVFVDERSARLKDGTLAGSILKPVDALRNMMEYCHASLESVLPCLTSTPARVLGLANKGRLEVGADADLTLLDPQGNLGMTIVGGKVVYRA
ncbi:MAG: N-acetylglucosamine-6-phosphate deacetylase [Anaerolineales bacterium]|nr:N-acetylglucosamine-6-phosphate deacetylase [Anaerolineales bacterium]MDW8446211.1 N-acetylglucosamine-6-phosphate deacetylase [Anaerolineales bacterium]